MILTVFYALLSVYAVWFASFATFPTVITSTTTGNDHSKVREFLSSGDFEKAIQASNELIEHDKNDFMAYFLKGMSLYALGKTDSAMDSWKISASKNKEYEQPLIQRAKHFLKEGKFEKGFFELDSRVKNTSEVQDLRGLLAKGERLFNDAELYFGYKKWGQAINILLSLVDISPFFVKARKMLLKSYIKSDNLTSAIAEVSKLSRIDDGEMSDYTMQLCKLHLATGDTKKGMDEVLQCLHYDPDNKECLKLFKALKKINKSLEDAEKLLHNNSESAIANIKESYKIYSLPESNPLSGFQDPDLPSMFDGFLRRMRVDLCKGYLKINTDSIAKDAIQWCTAALNGHEQESEHMFDLADAYMLGEEYESAVKQYQEILSRNHQDQRAQDGLQKAQNLLRQSKRKDYYKILGVPKTAMPKEIKRAYKKLALEYHPDKYRDDNTEFAQKKMSEINQAYEVLKDEETRKKYDAGVDPNDPTTGAGFNFGHGAGGQQFFFQRGGGGGGAQFGFDAGDIFEMFAQQQRQHAGGHGRNRGGAHHGFNGNFGNFRFDL